MQREYRWPAQGFFLNTLSIESGIEPASLCGQSQSTESDCLKYTIPSTNVFTAGENNLGQATVMYGSLERPPQDTWDEFDL